MRLPSGHTIVPQELEGLRSSFASSQRWRFIPLCHCWHLRSFMKFYIPRRPEQTFLVIPSNVFMILSCSPNHHCNCIYRAYGAGGITSMHVSFSFSFATGIHTHTRYTRFVLSSIVSCFFSSTMADLPYRVLALILFRPWDFYGRCENGCDVALQSLEL